MKTSFNENKNPSVSINIDIEIPKSIVDMIIDKAIEIDEEKTNEITHKIIIEKLIREYVILQIGVYSHSHFELFDHWFNEDDNGETLEEILNGNI